MSGRASRRRAKGVRDVSNVVCIHCQGLGSHFVPPGLGDIGFWICDIGAEA